MAQYSCLDINCPTRDYLRRYTHAWILKVSGERTAGIANGFGIPTVYDTPHGVVKHRACKRRSRVALAYRNLLASPFLKSRPSYTATGNAYVHTYIRRGKYRRENCSENVRAVSEGRGSIIEKCEVEGPLCQDCFSK